MTKPPKLSISKLDAARRQLDTAVRLYFQNADVVSIHTLTAAGYNILRDLTNARGKKPMLVKDSFLEWIRPGKEKEVRDKLNEAENFFKHADRDPEGSLEFSQFQTEILLFDACSQYYTLTGEMVPYLRLFESWFMFQNAEVFNLPPEMDRLVRSIGPEFASMSRMQYLQAVLPSLYQPGT